MRAEDGSVRLGNGLFTVSRTSWTLARPQGKIGYHRTKANNIATDTESGAGLHSLAKETLTVLAVSFRTHLQSTPLRVRSAGLCAGRGELDSAGEAPILGASPRRIDNGNGFQAP